MWKLINMHMTVIYLSETVNKWISAYFANQILKKMRGPFMRILLTTAAIALFNYYSLKANASTVNSSTETHPVKTTVTPPPNTEENPISVTHTPPSDVNRTSIISSTSEINRTYPPTHSTITTCSNLTDIPSGSRFANITEPYGDMPVNTTISIYCYPGYELHGDPHVVCQTNGTWSIVPECKVIKCSKPPEIDAASTYSNWTNEVTGNTTLKIGCFPGYNLTASGIVRCTKTDQWSSVPVCNSVSCPKIMNISTEGRYCNLTEPYGDMPVNTTIKVDCYPGYELHGDHHVVCQTNGTWSILPECTLIKCLNPPAINSVSTYSNWTNEVINMTGNITLEIGCYPGYNLTENGFVRCTKTDQWSSVTNCSIVYCRDVNFQNGNITPSLPVSANSSIDYTCNIGYELKGNKTSSCNYKGILDSVPECQLKNVNYRDHCNVTEQCTTANSTCDTVTTTCICINQNDFYLKSNNSCLERLPLGNDFNISDPEATNSSIFVVVTLNSADADNVYVEILINSTIIRTEYFKISETGNSNITLDSLTPGLRYELHVYLSHSLVPSSESRKFTVFTLPNCMISWNISSVTKDTITFKKMTSEKIEYYVLAMAQLKSFTANNMSCNDSSYCVFSQDVETIAVTNLLPGIEYAFTFKTAIEKEVNISFAISGEVCQTFKKYTVPKLPDGIDIPITSISDKRFQVKFANTGQMKFTARHVYVYSVFNDSVLVGNYSELPENTAINVSVNIKPATEYFVSVFVTVPEQTSSIWNKTIYTRPINSSPAQLGEILTTNITLMFNIDQNSAKYSHISIIVQNPDITFNGGVQCSDKSYNCTFEKPATNTSVKLSNLTAGTLYNVSVYTSIGGIANSAPQLIISYTEPSGIRTETVRITELTNSSIKTVWNKGDGHVDGYNVSFTCRSPNVNSSMNLTYQQTVTLTEATVKHLDPGSFCNISIEAFLVNTDNNTLYAGPVTTALNESTKETAPGNVDSLKILNTTSRSSVLSWWTPNTRNGILRHYIAWINYQNDTCERLSLWSCTDCDDVTSLNLSLLQVPACSKIDLFTFISGKPLLWPVTSLHPFRNYTAFVAAYTVDMGPRAKVQIITLEDIPGKPVNLQERETTFSSIKMQWLEPLERNGIVTNYTVKYSFFDRDCRQTVAPIELFKTLNTYVTDMELTESVYPYWDYNISVKATNNIGSGNYSDVYQVKTQESNPGVINETSSAFVFAQNATVKWISPCFPNGILTYYHLEITNKTACDHKVSCVYFVKVNASEHYLVLNDLLPFRNYSVRVMAENKAGNGIYSHPNEFQTAIDDPETPAYLSKNDINSTSIRVSWIQSKRYTGPTVYSVIATDLEKNEVVSIFYTHTGLWFDELATEAIIGNLDAYWNYSIDVKAVTSFGEQDTRYSNTSTIYIRTEEDVPGPVTNLIVRNETNLEKPRQLFVSWQPPTERDLNGIIVQYVIFCSNRDQKLNASSSDYAKNISLYIDNKVNVTVKVWAVTGKGNGTSTELVIPVSPGAPVHANETQATPLTKKADFSLDDDKKMVAVLLPKAFLCDNHNGKPEKWGVIVAEASKANETSFVGSLDEYEFHKSNYFWHWSKAIDEKNIPPYLATDSAWTPNCGKETNRRRRDVNNEEYLLFIVGNQDCSSFNAFCNGPLQPGRSYRVKSYACTASGCTETLYSHPIQTAPNLIPAIAGGLAAAVVVIVIVAVIVYTKRTNKLCFSGNSKTVESAHIGKTIEIPVVVSEYIFKPGAVELTAFPSHLERMHKDSNLLFADAFKMLKDKSPVHPCSAAESQQCRPKNRYTNIMPFDHSRVKLRALDDVEGSDFINANFVPGYTSPRAFIATQGPMQMLYDDFWRMVWEQNVDTIVMLTKLVEKGRIKCDQYWPNTKDPVFYGEVVVTIKSESNLSDYTLKIFEIKTSKGQSRMVKHFWYLKWPDMGCPDDPKMLLDFVKTVRQHTQRPDRTSPTVVHCSAGVGRTGTFIAVDNLLQHIRDHDSADIFQLVLDMREHRCNMVQTEDQFVYIYECLKAFITTDEEVEPVYQNADIGAENIYENAAFQTDL